MRFRLAIFSLCLAAFASSAAAQSMSLQPLPIVLPKPLFEGTPEPVSVPNLEKALGKPRPPFLAPAGTANVALHKLVTSSDSSPLIGDLDMVTDGNTAGTDGTYVELKAGMQTVTIDLEAPHTIYAILIWHYLKEARSYKGVVVQVADDPDFISDVRTLFNNDNDNSSGFGIGTDRRYVETAEGKLIDAKGVVARYVRLASQGSDRTQGSHYVEVEVFGKPVK
ncbi:MAG TPA: hypothetical protein VE959_37060 [Bryobacteraceae bacterium]|nr:hypothetical protein [Bryobacteraceae bacterium]